MDLGAVLATLGKRESGTEHLEQAVAAYRLALQENTRERVPLDWAKTQFNLGLGLADLYTRTQRQDAALWIASRRRNYFSKTPDCRT
jgi:hypothetical protein